MGRRRACRRGRPLPDLAVIRDATPETAAFVAAFDPAAALALVAGAREMCEAHQSVVDLAMAAVGGPRRYLCAACRTPDEWRDGQNWGGRRIVAPCPTLAALARMLGVDDA